MRSIRTFAYAAVLSLSLLSIQPMLAAAEEVRGDFTLSHEVHWQNRVLAPGDYSFSLNMTGPRALLTLRGRNGSRTDAILLIDEIETPKEDATAQLRLVSRGGESFVSALDLPRYDVSLHFSVPTDRSQK